MFRTRSRMAGGFTLVEIMIVAAVIVLLAVMAVPGFLRARQRAQASRIINDCRLLDHAVDVYATETNAKDADPVTIDNLLPFLKDDSREVVRTRGKDIFGRDYAVGPLVNDGVTVNVDTIGQFDQDVVDEAFWGPYRREP